MSEHIDNDFLTDYSIYMIDETLKKIGLSNEETEVYLSLLNSGTVTASQIAKQTSVKRTNVYNICDSLITKGLVTKKALARGMAFTPLSPDHLSPLAMQLEQRIHNAMTSLENILPSLKEQYKLIDERPIITVYEGIEGLKKIYKNILEEKDDILLLRSYYDDKRIDLDAIVMAQIKNQVKTGIHVRTITPLENSTKEVFLKHDTPNLVKRHIIHSTQFELPSQIIVYKNKVAMISLKKDIVATLIDNKDISDTFRMLFDFMWEKTEKEHEEIVAEWKD